MTYEDEPLDRFAIAAMPIVEQHRHQGMLAADYADDCYLLAIEMMKARDRAITTAKPAAEHVPPFPPIDGSAIPEKPAEIAANRLGFESFGYSERS